MMESALWPWHSESVTFYLLFSSSLLEQIEMLLLLHTCPLSWAHNHWQWILAASSPPYLRGKKKLLSYVVAHSCSMRPRWCNKMGATVQQEDKDGAEVEHKMVVNWASKPRIAMWECNYYCIFISCKTMEQKTISASSELLKLVTTSQLFLLLLLLLRLDCRYERQMKTQKEAWSKQQL